MENKVQEIPYFPMFFSLAGREVLVVGAGKIGSRRIETLLTFGASVLAVAPEGTDRMKELAGSQGKETAEEHMKEPAGERMKEPVGERLKEPAGERTKEAAAEEASAGRLVWKRRCFRPSDLDGKFLVIAASDDAGVNDQIVSLCRSRGILVNHAGDQRQCDFYFPGIVREGKLVAGVSSSGQDHGLVRKVSAAMRVWLREFCSRADREEDT